MVFKRGIEIDLAKSKAILKMQPPKIEKEIRRFLHELQYISRFISQLVETCRTIFKKLRKDALKAWDDECQKEGPILDSKMAKWTTIFAAFDLKYIAKKAIKGSVIAVYLAASPSGIEMDDNRFLDKDIHQIQSNTWRISFDGATNNQGYGVGVVIVTLSGERLPFSIKLAFQVTNNEAEYKACITGLETALRLQIKHLTFFKDFIMIVSQALKKWKIKEQRLVPYHQHLDQFKELSFHNLTRAKNQSADALATLALMVDVNPDMVNKPLNVQIRQQPAHCCSIQLIDGKPWF
ncbi:uncharacterized protein LOC110010926 [Jatropha curcas]|uniref:uncharacterized protein LOC110010926 n=1 Tax=Jatropha curcas TaxID=180498 RepID=UPI0009D6D00C|nr:uncharacterized protein LOC110010926 [Jatropha curcas]